MVHAKLKHSSDEMPTVRLMKAMHFGGKDLDLNRAGEVSDTQKKHLIRTLGLHGAVYGCFVVVMAAGFYYGWRQMPVFPRLRGGGGEAAPELFIVGFLLITLVTLLAIGAPQSLYRQWKTLNTGQVIPFTGRVRKHADARSVFLIVINHELQTEQIYTLDGAAYNAFIDGEIYTVYSLSTAPTTILTAEHVLVSE